MITYILLAIAIIGILLSIKFWMISYGLKKEHESLRKHQRKLAVNNACLKIRGDIQSRLEGFGIAREFLGDCTAEELTKLTGELGKMLLSRAIRLEEALDHASKRIVKLEDEAQANRLSRFVGLPEIKP